jgi:hypothetical protein
MATNPAQIATLTATNFLGQNSSAIEQAYSEGYTGCIPSVPLQLPWHTTTMATSGAAGGALDGGNTDTANIGSGNRASPAASLPCPENFHDQHVELIDYTAKLAHAFIQAMAVFGAENSALDTSSPLGQPNSVPALGSLFVAGQPHPV